MSDGDSSKWRRWLALLVLEMLAAAFLTYVWCVAAFVEQLGRPIVSGWPPVYPPPASLPGLGRLVSVGLAFLFAFVVYAPLTPAGGLFWLAIARWSASQRSRGWLVSVLIVQCVGGILGALAARLGFRPSVLFAAAGAAPVAAGELNAVTAGWLTFFGATAFGIAALSWPRFMDQRLGLGGGTPMIIFVGFPLLNLSVLGPLTGGHSDLGCALGAALVSGFRDGFIFFGIGLTAAVIVAQALVDLIAWSAADVRDDRARHNERIS